MLLLLLGALTAITTPSCASASLSWKDNSDNEDGFHIERSENGSPFRRIASLPRDTTSFKDTDTVSGVEYRYRVQAYNAFGVSGYTNTSRFELPVLISYEEWISSFLANQTASSSPPPPEPQMSAEIRVTGTTSALLSSIEGEPSSSLNGAQISNLLCYVHGINPYSPDFTLLATHSTRLLDGIETHTIERAVFKYSTGIETVLQGSADMQHWFDLPLRKRITSETDLHRWESIQLPRDEGIRFFRLKLSLASRQSF
ncbi:fibronectin type III domain-containing protein [Pelagicoccus enzymogenes]|uniref:fibronectin type III domain-containing protein n=1 Tax=Pelagicoccus enzymogenes TaxID=2773457 RepID=UPI0028104342|nr:fibronectin type III domain-containing protein [Pelagicoccus enzymogenes]MDQ8196643.1 fibronectin type III domain-containing protein [Pelagicoccus enzymogenes]